MVLSGWSSLISKYGCLPGVKKTKKYLKIHVRKLGNTCAE
jgi:hypothetical protein